MCELQKKKSQCANESLPDEMKSAIVTESIRLKVTEEQFQEELESYQIPLDQLFRKLLKHFKTGLFITNSLEVMASH